MRVLAAVSLFLVFLATPAAAQRDDSPARPPLPADADTNDAAVYYDLGLALIKREPHKAADAFYWAGALNPTSADAFYARRVALLMSRRHILQHYLRGDRRTMRSREVQQADSLYLRALQISPFFYRKLDGVFFDAIIREIALKAVGPGGDVGEAEYHIRSYLLRAPADFKAWHAYSRGRFDEALSLYAKAIKSARAKASLRVDRGRLFFQLDRADSALAELTLAVAELRAEDDRQLVYVYQSKALIEHSIGIVHLRLGDPDAARAAFGRALEEDMAYGPAHIQLGFMAVDAGDTATAISELELATQLAPDDAALRYFIGYALQQFGRSAEAEAQLRKAIEANPVYAAPHFVLARSLSAQGRTQEAASTFDRFLALASRTDPRRDEASQALAQLGRD